MFDFFYFFVLVGVIILGLAFFEAQITNLCTSIYLHRYKTHAAIQEISPFIEIPMQAILWLMTGINTAYWRAVHLAHHKNTDEEGDPHSPYLEGLQNIIFHNVRYYRKARGLPDVREFLRKTRQGWFDRNAKFGPKIGAGLHIILVFVAMLYLTSMHWFNSLVLGAVIGLLIFFGHAGIYVLLNSFVNGLGHKGCGHSEKPEKPGRNVGWLAWITAGEGWHKNHHDRPGSAKLGSIDFGWWLIKGFEKAKLIKIKT